jgi:hypothetical protein
MEVNMANREKEEERLRPKYQVQRIINTGPEEVCERVGSIMMSTDPDDINSPFVLMPRKDPAAFSALILYAALCEHQLGNEVRYWLRRIAEAEPKYGTQGIRNIRAMKNLEIARSFNS